VHVDDVAITSFRHDVDPAVLHTHERTDEWIFVLSGHAVARVGNERFDVGPNDFVGHPAGGGAHAMEAVDELSYLMGGQIDATDIVNYPQARRRRVAGVLEPQR
jgi:uncharacterized cupin superfamily protein